MRLHIPFAFNQAIIAVDSGKRQSELPIPLSASHVFQIGTHDSDLKTWILFSMCLIDNILNMDIRDRSPLLKDSGNRNFFSQIRGYHITNILI